MERIEDLDSEIVELGIASAEIQGVEGPDEEPQLMIPTGFLID